MKAAALLLITLTASTTLQAEPTMPPAQFATPTINIGTVVSDIEASAKFYTEAIGFTEVAGFHIPAGFAKDSGLTDGKEFDVRSFVLEKGTEGATTLKLIQFSDGKGTRGQNDFIDTQLGFRYLTIVIKDTKAALARLEAAGVKPLAKGPARLPEALNPELSLTIVRDPDGNLVELVGPAITD